MDERKVVKANPPPTMRMFLPSRISQGYQLPNGPRRPMMSPTFMLCRWVVTTPARLTVNLTNPFSTGDEAMPMGISPLPGMESSPNWPAL